MRVSKFRGWNGVRWLYGNLSDDREYTDTPEFSIDLEVKIMPMHAEEWVVDGSLRGIDWFCVSELSVGEWTGFRDPTGAEIYEGDIIKLNFDSGRYFIKYDGKRRASYMMVPCDNPEAESATVLDTFIREHCKIIDNLYENEMKNVASC